MEEKHRREIEELQSSEESELENWKREKERRMGDLSVQLGTLTEEL